LYRLPLGAYPSNLVDVNILSPHVIDAHVDLTLHAELRADRGDGDTVLAGARLGDNAALAHLTGEEHLPQRIVDFVRPRVAEILAFEPDLGATHLLGEPVGAVHGCRAATEG